jgi:hypothetical protein
VFASNALGNIDYIRKTMEIKDTDVLVSSSSVTDSAGSVTAVSVKPKNPRGAGRPKKSAIAAKKKRELRGRPPGEAARIREFHARLLTTKGDHIIETIIKKALDPTDKDQAAMLKMCADRLLPLSYFEKAGTGQGKAGITINISGITDAKVEAEQVIDAEDVDYNDN